MGVNGEEKQTLIGHDQQYPTKHSAQHTTRSNSEVWLYKIAKIQLNKGADSNLSCAACL